MTDVPPDPGAATDPRSDPAVRSEPESQSLENSRLRAQIEDLHSALEAIRAGGVDAVVMNGPGGEQIYTLSNADRPYRVLVDEMGEGAATVSGRGVVLYANRRLATLLGRDSTRGLPGRDVTDLVPEAHRDGLRQLLTVAPGDTVHAELDLARTDGSTVPVLVSVTGLEFENIVVRCIVAADLTDRRRAEREIAELNAAMLQTKRRSWPDAATDSAASGNWSPPRTSSDGSAWTWHRSRSATGTATSWSTWKTSVSAR